MSFHSSVEQSQLAAPAVARYWPTIALLAMQILLAGCAGGITGVALDASTRTVCDASGAVCGVSDKDQVTFNVAGQGECGTIGIDFGDGTTQQTSSGSFKRLSPPQIGFQHEYTNQHPLDPTVWPGPKTVHAFSVANCAGEARMRVNVLLERTDPAGHPSFHPSFLVGLAQPTALACNVASPRFVRTGATVSITEIPGSPMINFGCAFGGCINDMSGNSGATNAGFPFSTLRRHSLVLRIVGSGGTQVVQGSTQTRFVVAQTGPLEFCVNDDVLADNTGGWGMAVTVDETTIP